MRSAWTSPEGFEALVREHQRSVFATLHRLTGPGGHVEDLAQEVFLRLYRALPEFRGDAQLSTYLYRITVNVAQDEWKRRRREQAFRADPPPSAEESDPDWLENLPAPDTAGAHLRTPEQHLSAREAEDAVTAALAALPEMERTILVLYHQEELSYEGIAAVLQMPLNTVRTHLHRGRKRLAALVKQRGAAPASATGYAVQGRAG